MPPLYRKARAEGWCLLSTHCKRRCCLNAARACALSRAACCGSLLQALRTMLSTRLSAASAVHCVRDASPRYVSCVVWKSGRPSHEAGRGG